MTSTSEQHDIEKLINQRLDQANEGLDERVRADISHARMRALRAARQQKSSRTGFISQLISSCVNYKWQLSMPMAVAAAVVILVSYTSRETIPAFPTEMLVADIPTEDLELLEDLEFATWLVQQEQGATN